jgi:diguanylate cyclase (GGDEF)-like protein
MLDHDLAIYKNKASFDALTALYNRATFMELMQEELLHAKLVGGDLSLLLLDIDHFKHVNDTYGHQAGDLVLSSLGELLRSLLRSQDVPARYGGEEFIILARFTTTQQAVIVAEKIRKGVAEHTFGKLPQAITVSIGCSTYRLGELPDSLIQRADLALYDAKNHGRNRVSVR